MSSSKIKLSPNPNQIPRYLRYQPVLTITIFFVH